MRKLAIISLAHVLKGSYLYTGFKYLSKPLKSDNHLTISSAKGVLILRSNWVNFEIKCFARTKEWSTFDSHVCRIIELVHFVVIILQILYRAFKIILILPNERPLSLIANLCNVPRTKTNWTSKNQSYCKLFDINGII